MLWGYVFSTYSIQHCSACIPASLSQDQQLKQLPLGAKIPLKGGQWSGLVSFLLAHSPHFASSNWLIVKWQSLIMNTECSWWNTNFIQCWWFTHIHPLFDDSTTHTLIPKHPHFMVISLHASVGASRVDSSWSLSLQAHGAPVSKTSSTAHSTAGHNIWFRSPGV